MRNKWEKSWEWWMCMTIERVREHEWEWWQMEQVWGEVWTFGTDSNTWQACPLDVIIGLTRAFSLGQELVVYTMRTWVFGGMSADWVNVLPAPFGCCNDLGLCRRVLGLKRFLFSPLQVRLMVVGWPGWDLLLLHSQTHIFLSDEFMRRGWNQQQTSHGWSILRGEKHSNVDLSWLFLHMPHRWLVAWGITVLCLV